MALDVNTALCTVDAVLAELGAFAPSPLSPDDEAYIESLITAASSAIAAYAGRPLGFEAGIIEGVLGKSWPWATLTRTPVLEVSEVTLDEDVIDAEGYVLERKGASGVVLFRCRWPFTGQSGGAVARAPIPGTEVDDVLVFTYSGGWALPGQTGLPAGVPALPAHIARACVLAVTSWFMGQGEDRSVTTERLMSWQASYERAGSAAGVLADFPPASSGMLRGLRRVAQA